MKCDKYDKCTKTDCGMCDKYEKIKYIKSVKLKSKYTWNGKIDKVC